MKLTSQLQEVDQNISDLKHKKDDKVTELMKYVNFIQKQMESQLKEKLVHLMGHK